MTSEEKKLKRITFFFTFHGKPMEHFVFDYDLRSATEYFAAKGFEWNGKQELPDSIEDVTEEALYADL
jgi:hypothetical protein